VPLARGWASFRVGDLEGAFRVWEGYMSLIHGYRDVLVVRYEELMQDPARVLGSVFRHLALSPDRVSGVLDRVPMRPERAHAFRGDPELDAFAATVADRLEAYGYGP
jgi:hypothetical protein